MYNYFQSDYKMIPIFEKKKDHASNKIAIFSGRNYFD